MNKDNSLKQIIGSIVLIVFLIVTSYLFFGKDKPYIEHNPQIITPVATPQPTLSNPIPCDSETNCKG